MAKIKFLPRTFINVLDGKDRIFKLVKLVITKEYEGTKENGWGDCDIIIRKIGTQRHFKVPTEFYSLHEDGSPNLESNSCIDTEAIFINDFKC